MTCKLALILHVIVDHVLTDCQPGEQVAAGGRTAESDPARHTQLTLILVGAAARGLTVVNFDVHRGRH